MNILVILGHPDSTSFNHAIARQVCESVKANGHTLLFHDLYKEQFPPVLPAEEIEKDSKLPLDIIHHCEELTDADGIVIIHPNWWGMPPALLKGWIDRVIRPGEAYKFVENDSGEGVPLGLLKAQQAIIFNTSNTIKERENSIFGDPLERIWKDCIFDLCGVKKTYRRMFRVIVTSTLEERQEWLNEVHKTVEDLFPSET